MSFLLEFVCCAFFTIIPLTMCRLVQFQLRQTISDFISPGPPLKISQKGCINQSARIGCATLYGLSTPYLPGFLAIHFWNP